MPVRSFRPLTENDASNRAHHDNSQRVMAAVLCPIATHQIQARCESL